MSAYVKAYEYEAPEPPFVEKRLGSDRRKGTPKLWYKENEDRRIEQRRVHLSVPEKEGTPVTTLTFENGMNAFAFREKWDDTAADRLVDWLSQLGDGIEFVGIPTADSPEKFTWYPMFTIRKLLHIHDGVTISPLAVRSQRGKELHLAGHGPGKRRK